MGHTFQRYRFSTQKQMSYHDEAIAVVAGGPTYGPAALRLLRRLRRVRYLQGQRVHVFVYTLDSVEQDHTSIQQIAQDPFVTVISLDIVRPYPLTHEDGWAAKITALRRTPAHKVLLLDADNVPLCSIPSLFNSKALALHGVVLWPDTAPHSKYDEYSVSPAYQNTLSQKLVHQHESGQILVNKRHPGIPDMLAEAERLNHSVRLHTYAHMYGDKDTYAIACRNTGIPFFEVRMRPAVAVLNKRPTGFVQAHPDFEGHASTFTSHVAFFHDVWGKHTRTGLYRPLFCDHVLIATRNWDSVFLRKSMMYTPQVVVPWKLPNTI